MKTLLFLFVSIIFFTSCSSHSVATYLNKDEFYTNSLQYTKKADIVNENEVEIIFIASYLNRYDENFDDDYENFVVSVYKNKVSKTNIEDFSLFLDDVELSSIKTLPNDDELVKKIALKNIWATYYLVRFEKSDSSNLKLQLKLENSKEAHINFQKRY